MRNIPFYIFVFFTVFVSAKNYYVSNNGNDLNDGLSEQSAWKTINKVNEEMSKLTSGDIIYFRGGDEFIGTLVISNKNGLEITSFGSGMPIIKGSKYITGWTEVENNVWTVLEDDTVFNVFKSNKPLVNARIPNLTNPNDSQSNYLNVSNLQNEKNEFTCNELIGLSIRPGARVFLKTKPFDMESHEIKYFDSASGKITLDGDVKYNISKGVPFFITNDFSLLNQQNEWFYNLSLGRVFIYSTTLPENISLSIINDSGIKILNSSNISVNNIIVRGFKDDGILVDNYSSNNSLRNNIISDCNNSGVNLVSGTGNHVSNNTISNITKYGIVTNAAKSCIIEDNDIKDIFLLKNIFNNLTLGQGGIYIASDSKNNIVRRNSIQNIGYNGINLTKSYYSVVKENYLKDYCLTLEDGGAIYIYGSDDLNNEGHCTISKNIIIDYNNFLNPRRMRHGIYLDDHSHDVTVTSNSISGSNHGIFLHNAHDNIVEGNRIYETTGDAIYLSADSETGGKEFGMINNMINNNEIYLSKTKLPTTGVGIDYARATPIAIGIKSDWSRFELGNFDFNKYYTVGSLTPVGIETKTMKALGYPNTKKRILLEEWVELSGQDNNSVVSPEQKNNFNIINSSTSNLIPNGDFESELNGWQKWNTAIHNDAKYLHISPKISWGSVVSPLIRVENSKDYLFEFEAFSEKTSTFLVKIVQNSDWDNVIEIYLVDIAPGWNKYSFPFDKRISDDINIEFTLNSSQGHLGLDNLKFVEATYGTLSPQSFFAYNASGNEESILIPTGTWESLNGNLYNGSVDLDPFSSKILISSNKSIGMINANAGSDQQICQGESVTLTASGGSGYSWSTGATTASIEVSPSETTTYIVTVSEGGSSDTDQVNVEVNTVTAGAGGNQTIESGNSATLTASGGDSYSWSNGETTQSIEVSPSQTTTYTVTVKKGNCEDTDSVIVTVNKPAQSITANAGSDQQICQGESVTLTASGGSSYSWSTGAITASIEVNPSETTMYTVTVSEEGASDTDQVEVEVNTVTAIVGQDKTIELGSSVKLSASGGDSYEWNTGETIQSIEVSPSETTTYSVTVKKGSCEDTDSVKISVNAIVSDPQPAKADAGEDQTICLGESVILSGSGGYDYRWSTGEDSKIIKVNPTRTTTYTLEATSDGVISTDRVSVVVENCLNNMVDEEIIDRELLVYPNPAHGILNILLNSMEEEMTLEIVSMNGSLIRSERLESDNNGIAKHIDLSGITKGIYVLRLKNTNYVGAKKIVIN